MGLLAGHLRHRGGGGGLAALGHLLQPGLPDIDNGQQEDHGDKEDGGDGVDLRAHPLLGHAVDGHGQGGRGGAGGEVADDEVVDAHGEGGEGPGDDARLDLRQDHLVKSLEPGAAQILGGVNEVLVQLAQLGAYRQKHIGDVEGDVGDEQGGEAQGEPGGQHQQGLDRVEPEGEVLPQGEEGHEKQAHGNAGDDVGVHHGDVVYCGEGVPGAPAQAVEADGGKGAGDGGDHRGQQRHQKGGVEASHDDPVLKQLPVPVEGKAPPDYVTVILVEGEDDEQNDGGVEKEEDQERKKTAEGGVFLHSTTACSSPSPKRFITHIQSTTMTIITRAMAAPSWGL